jgi:hypothetical protein
MRRIQPCRVSPVHSSPREQQLTSLTAAITPSRVCIRCAKLATILVRVVEYCEYVHCTPTRLAELTSEQ